MSRKKGNVPARHLVILSRAHAYDTIKTMRNPHPTNLKNVVWKEREQYVAQCLNVDVSSFGDTKKEALVNLDEALDLYFQDRGHGDIPTIEQVEIANNTPL